jgi:hypothetical protein
MRARGRLARCAALGLLAFGVGGPGSRVVDAGARDPLTIDRFIQQGPKLTAKGEVGSVATGQGKFGFSAALSANGRTALIGGYADNGNRGAVWVFNRSGATWKQQGAKLTATTELSEGEFGYSVALSADGNTALIGGVKDAGTAGAAWVFTRSGAIWKQQVKLHGSKPAPAAYASPVDDGFGSSVALSADGKTALIGAGTFDENVGEAFVFKRSGSNWVRQGKILTGKGKVGVPGFGTSVALSADGNTAAIGGSNDSQASGAVWIFTRSGSTWTQQGPKLRARGERGQGFFGCSVALSADGNAALFGACSDSNNAGAAWVFTRSGSTWTQGPRLTARGGSPKGLFGLSVRLSAKGNMALIGGPGGKAGLGAAWVFTRSGSTWTQRGSALTAPGESGPASFGYCVALSSDGKIALIGGPGDQAGVGAVWMKVERS